MKRAKVSKEKDSDLSEPQPKRRKGQNLLLRYPMTNQLECEDSESLEQHRQAISKELEKAKPRDSVLLPLLRSTYGERRMYILNEASCVKGILEKFPSMRRPCVVCMVMSCCSLLIPLSLYFPADWAGNVFDIWQSKCQGTVSHWMEQVYPCNFDLCRKMWEEGRCKVCKRQKKY